jgi:hypothetical protein
MPGLGFFAGLVLLGQFEAKGMWRKACNNLHPHSSTTIKSLIINFLKT